MTNENQNNQSNKSKYEKFVDWVNADADLPPYEEDMVIHDEHHGHDDHHDDHGDRLALLKRRRLDDVYRTEEYEMEAVDEEFDYSEMFEADSKHNTAAEAAAALIKETTRKITLRAGVRERFQFAQVVFTLFSIGLTVSIVAVLLFTLSYMPPFGDPSNPTNNELYLRYIEKGLEETGAQNIVAAMILDYRAFDTLGEAFALFTALVAVIMLIRTSGGAKVIFVEPEQPLMLRFMIMLIAPFVLIYGLYILFNGHLTPGGGFSGGAILGSAISLYAIAYGAKKVRTLFSFKRLTIFISIALLFYSVVKGYSFTMGASGLSTGIPLGTPGNLFSGGLIMPLNVAVGIVVACTVYGLYALFSEGEV